MMHGDYCDQLHDPTHGCNDNSRPVDMVNHPPHYKQGGIETIDVIEAWQLDFCLGNAVKYISRAGKKGDMVEDLEKAQWYLTRAIANRKSGDGNVQAP